jgi:phage terminase small subunit
MKPVSELPSDLDYQAKKKWLELSGSVDVDADLEILANYCRTHSSLLAIRREKTKQMKAGKFRMMTPGRDKTLVLNPLIREENRMVASLNRMLKGLGLASSREEVERKRPSVAEEHAKWVEKVERIMSGMMAWNPQTGNFEDCPQIEPLGRVQ